jgi:hypothetical protein
MDSFHFQQSQSVLTIKSWHLDIGLYRQAPARGLKVVLRNGVRYDDYIKPQWGSSEQG